MIQLRCTQTLLKGWNLKPEHLAEIKENTSPLGSWYAHLFTLDRRKTIIFVNENTLVSFIIYGVKKGDTEKLAQSFLLGVAQVLLMLGVTKDKIAQILTEYRDVEFTESVNSSLLDSLNDLVAYYKKHVQRNGRLKYTDVDTLIYLANKLPQYQLKWQSSIDYLHQILDMYYK
ncbi:hypothetical protein DRI50_02850 [candidate division KSB1 bacterium]|nr:MAG: hypothetical protein DRI50_02850 [candidate division KSB1 bacterium]